MKESTKKALFLCTGNYYRSRFAEILFNHHIKQKNRSWSAFSRGLKQESTPGNIGPISPNAIPYLIKNGIFSIQFFRFPKKVVSEDFEKARLVIALKESEHRPYMKSHFPEWENVIEYWQIDDVDVAPPQKVLPELEEKVMELVVRINSGNLHQ